MKHDTASLWGAARRFEGILKHDPEAYSFAPLSDIYRKLGLIDDALETARKGVERYPDFAAGQLARARAALDSGIAAEAVVALEVVVRVTPENLEAQRLLAELYAAAGKQAAAAKCLVLAASLDLEPPPVAPEKAVAAPLEEEVPEADIIELSDEFIEVEGVTDTTNPFAALPDRPSLGEDFVRAEPYLIKTVPPAAPAAMEPQETAAPAIASATIAELYISQGFPDKGVEMYRELLASDPRNELYQRRLTELVPPPVSAAGIQTTASSESVLDKLQEWLANIGRVREWRTKSF